MLMNENMSDMKLLSFTLIGKQDAPLEAGEANSEKIAHSEKLFHEFMKSNEANDSEIAKEEVSRLRNGKVFAFQRRVDYQF